MDEATSTRTSTGYLQLGYLLLVFHLSAPLNVFSLRRTLIYLRCCHAERRRVPSFTRLRLLLHFADLLVVLLYVPMRFGWLLMDEWIAGELACRVLTFLSMFGISLVTNIIACIALDRTFRAFKLRKFHGARDVNRSRNTTTVLCIGAVIMALMVNAPQLFLSELTEENMGSCECSLHFLHRQMNKTADLEHHNLHSDETNKRLHRYYDVYQTVILFWLPMSVAVLCYTAIVYRLQYELTRHSSKSPNPGSRATGVGVSSLTLTGPSLTWSQSKSAPQIPSIVVPSRNKTPSPEDKTLRNNAKSLTQFRILRKNRFKPSAHPNISEPQLSTAVFVVNGNNNNNDSQLQLRTAPPTEVIRRSNTLTPQPMLFTGNEDKQSQSNPDLSSPSVSNTQQQEQPSKRRRRRVYDARLIDARKKTLRKAFIVFFGYVSLWTPYTAMCVYRLVFGESKQLDGELASFLFSLTVGTTLVNPVIYGVRS